jgi:hypothetical protein
MDVANPRQRGRRALVQTSLRRRDLSRIATNRVSDAFGPNSSQPRKLL